MNPSNRSRAKSKGKQVESSQPNKRSKKQSSSGLRDEDMIPADQGRDKLPNFTRSTKLSEHDPEIRKQLYFEKLKKGVKHKDNIFLCERAIDIEDYETIGLVEKFRRLGWEAALTFRDEGHGDNIPTKAILEWMSTLEKEEGDNPPVTTKLRGWVGKKEMIMSFDTIRTIVNFDSKESNLYEYPDEESICKPAYQNEVDHAILDALFRKNKKGNFITSDLHIMPKLLNPIALCNVIPKLGDKGYIRQTDVRIMYELAAGNRMLSLRHLVLMNVWASHESADKKMIPHCRLITALMREQGVLQKNTVYLKKAHKYFIMSKFKEVYWKYRKTETHLMLRDKRTKEMLTGLLPNAQPLEPGQEMEALSSDSVASDSDDENEDVGSGHEQLSLPIHRSLELPAIEERIREMRPPGYENWSPMDQYRQDVSARESIFACDRHEELMRKQQEILDNNNLYARNQQYQFQSFLNQRYMEGRTGSTYRVTQPSSWVPLPPTIPQEQSSSGSSDPFNFQKLQELMTGWFGPQLPPQANIHDSDMDTGGTR
ncbi:hypothetical protein QVD17_09895 [Tagetes erecta]|uniref:Uncharacterized protein n=1 Tax=Tagetes erecta TaxID=13708 RepID=A0AAD8P5Q1_TARER|nr:hypothetical protein QVD17_09895 [Tagetes erecta]